MRYRSLAVPSNLITLSRQFRRACNFCISMDIIHQELYTLYANRSELTMAHTVKGAVRPSYREQFRSFANENRCSVILESHDIASTSVFFFSFIFILQLFISVWYAPLEIKMKGMPHLTMTAMDAIQRGFFFTKLSTVQWMACKIPRKN